MSDLTNDSTGGPRPPHRVLIAGAGVAALEALFALNHLAGDRLEIDLLAATPDFVYRPLRVVEPFEPGQREHRLPLSTFTRDLGAGHVFDDLAAVDVEARRARGTSGADYGYDSLLVATGARAGAAGPGAVAAGDVRSIAFVVPPGPAWPLPAYELALLTASWSWERNLRPDLVVVTPEPQPLAAFGESVGQTVAGMLERHAVEFDGQASAESYADGGLTLADGRVRPVDAAVALAGLAGPGIPGLPVDDDGFVRVDEHARVPEAPGVFVAGDAAAWPVKHGGLAAQQADVAAEAIASSVGVPVRPSTFRPVLRGVLLAGDERVFVRSDTRFGRTRSAARLTPLWWPPAKVAGRYLAPQLAARGIRVPAEPTGPAARPTPAHS